METEIRQRKIMLPAGITPGNMQGNPRFMVLYGDPKSGKSTICSRLTGALVIDLADEYEFLDAMKVKINNCEEMKDLMEEMKDTKRRFPYIVVDNATTLYEMVKPYALRLYKSTAAGKTYRGLLEDIPYGGCFYWPKHAFLMHLNALKKFTDTLILVGHIKDETGDHEKPGSKTSINLIGQLRQDVLGLADTVGRVYREGNKNKIDFAGNSNFLAQSRLPRLRCRDITIAESDESGMMKTYWNEVFTNEKAA